MENPTFHVSKLKSFNKDERHKDKKHAYHPIYDFIEHRLDGWGQMYVQGETNHMGKQTICCQVEKVPPKGGPMSKTKSFRLSAGNGGQVWIGKGAWNKALDSKEQAPCS